MNKSEFNREYSELERDILECVDRDTSRCMLNQECLRLLHLLSKRGRTLIPNLLLGELALCAEEWDGYSVSEQVRTVLANRIKSSDSMLFFSDFLEEEVHGSYDSIVVFPLRGMRTNFGRSEVAYLEKSLRLLAPGGRLIALVPQNITAAPAFKNLREFILSRFSLEAVISVKRIYGRPSFYYSVLVIENKPQADRIYYSLGGSSADETYNDYINGKGGFFVSSNEVYDRIDANYYDPKYKEVRELVQNRDTVRLCDLAEVFRGASIHSTERKTYGDYLIISHHNISNGEVNIGGKEKSFCSKDTITSDQRRKKSILKHGDVLISITGKPNWAIYRGDEDFAVANHNVAIIRGKESASEWLRLFFHTKTGIEYLESQLQFFSHCGVFHNISIRDLADMAVPDSKMMKITDRVQRGKDLEAKVANLFKELGWDVQATYGNSRIKYDIALFFNQKLRGVVEVKSYKSQQLRDNTTIVEQLRAYRKELGDVSIYLFVDDEIYEYDDGRLDQLAELPRPEKKKTKRKTADYCQNYELPIEKRSIGEVSLTDKTLLEMTFQYEAIMTSLSRIEHKVDSIAEKIEALSKQISGFQSLVDKQLDMAVTPEEEERIIHAFSEECAERIMNEVDERNANKEFNSESTKLVLTFGESAWGKMDESSRTFLASSKVMFNNLAGMQDIVDYSGVCLLVTKALEVELGKRFCKNFVAFLKEKYPGRANYPIFPTALLDRYGKPLKPKHFTLGSVAYVLCYLTASDLTEEQKNNNKSKLIEYSREKLFTGRTDEEIIRILHDYAESVEEVKNDYRNPSAHTNKIHRVDAEQCFALVVDVEKLLKRMLDSFDE